MKSAATLVLGAVLASVAIAQPHKPHHARHHKRQNAETTVVVTDWVYETETIDVTTTIWVSPGFVEPEVTSSSASPSTTSPSTTTTSSISQSAAQFFEPASTSSTLAPPPPASTSSTSVASSTPSPVYVAPTTSTASSVYVAPVVQSSTSIYVAPVVVPTTTTPAAVQYTAPAESTSAAAAPVATSDSSSSSSSSSSGGVCSSGSPCTGDITYYEAGLGACGTTNNGDSEKVVALPHGLMGTQSNGNPYCGKTITVSYKGKTTQATVVDKCMGCEGDSIDLSNAAFLDLAELSIGRASAEWWFN